MKKSYSHKPYALVCLHEDNPSDVQIIEYFYAPEPAFDLAEELNNKKIVGRKYEVMKYD